MKLQTMERFADQPACHRIWKLALASMIMAAATGLLYRGQLLFGWVEGLSLTNIRHAHSHLMFFSWVTPVPMLYFSIRRTAAEESVGHGLIFWMYWITMMGLLSYPFFLLFGYRPAVIGSMELPLSVMLSGLVMIGWYGYTWSWWRFKKRSTTDRDGATALFEGALLMLVLSSFSAWGVAATSMGRIDLPELTSGFTHLFLALFTNGWAFVAALAMIAAHLQERSRSQADVNDHRPGRWLLLILAGAPLTFPLGMGAGTLPEVWLLTARLGALLLASGLLLLLVTFWLSREQLNGPLQWQMALFSAVAILLFCSAGVPGTIWTGSVPLRVFFLHLLLLGGVSLTFLWIRFESYGRSGRVLWAVVAVGVAGMLLFLILHTPLAGRWISVGTPVGRELTMLWISVWIVTGLVGMYGLEVRLGTPVSECRNQMHRSVEKQKKRYHVGHGVGIGTDQHGEDNHDDPEWNQLEADQKNDPEKSQKESKGHRNE
ncbi:MAG: hypothetical protein WEA36_03705 [Balneolaceae bacterium]